MTQCRQRRLCGPGGSGATSGVAMGFMIFRNGEELLMKFQIKYRLLLVIFWGKSMCIKYILKRMCVKVYTMPVTNVHVGNLKI